MASGQRAGERTVSFLFSDLEGSTRLLTELGERYPAALERHWELVRAAAAAHDGVEFGAEGDAMFFSFDDPTAATLTALDAQRAHLTEPWPGGTVLRVRMAVHHGCALPALGTWLGVDVHQTARTCAAGHGGQVLVSAAAAAAVSTERLASSGAGLRDLGDFELRDIPGRQRLFQLTHAELADELPPLRTRAADRTNLPHQRSTFVGRRRDVLDAARLVERGKVLTIAGPGGAGKTRLSLEVAGHVGPHFADGAWLVELAGLSRGDDLDAHVAATLAGAGVIGADPSGGDGSGAARAGLLAALRDRELVLVLDNCEHVIDAAADLVAALLQGAVHSAVIATTREPLAVRGELVWRIPAMGIESSVRLFLDRAAAAGVPDAALTDVDTVTRVCDRLDGLPLAVELAASRAVSMAVGDMERNLDRRLAVLTTRGRDLEPRQRSLGALIEWSYELLTEEERRLLRALGRLPGSFSLDIAERTAPPDVDALGALDGLVRKSVVVSEVTDDGASRYRLLEALRAFALDRLDAEGESDATAVRLADGLLFLLDEATGKLSGPDQAAWLDRIDADLPAYRAALEWALAADPERALALAGRLGRFFGSRGALVEGRSWLERALAAAPAGQDPPLPALLSVLSAAGVIARMQGDLAAARAHHERQLVLAEASGSPALRATSLSALGNVLLLDGDLDGAAAVFETSHALRLELGDEEAILRSLNNLGVLASRRGDAEGAERRYEELLERARVRADMRILGQTLHNLADLRAAAGRVDEAIGLLDEALVHLTALGDRRSVGMTSGLRAAVALRVDDRDGAVHFAAAALEALVGVGDPVALGLAVDVLAAAAVAEAERRPGSGPGLEEAAVLAAASAALPEGEAERGVSTEDAGAATTARLRLLLGDERYDELARSASSMEADDLLERARAAVRAFGTG